MKKTIKLSLLLFMSLVLYPTSKTVAQNNGYGFTLAGYYNYTITSHLYNNPKNPDVFIRSRYQYIEYLPSYSFDLRYKISESVLVGLGAEYFRSSIIYNEVEGISQSGAVTLYAEDGYEMFPVELSFYYSLPFSTDIFEFFMGGGVGVYFGNSIRSVEGVGSTTQDRDYDFGIHVIVGMDYMLFDNLSIRGQMKFRDPQFEMKSAYNSSSVTVEGETVLIRNSTFYTKVNVDGIVFSIGAAYSF